MNDEDVAAGARARDRRSHLLEMLRDRGEMAVADAHRLLGVSVETLRRDLRLLESQGLIWRSYGRMFPVESGAFETGLTTRRNINREEKLRIATAVIPRLGTAQTIFIDEGFGTELIASALPNDRRFIVVTASLPIATLLAPRSNIEVIVLGGRVRGNTLGVVDASAVEMINGFNFDVAIVGANGISVEHGMTTPDPAVAAVKSAVISRAIRRILVGAHHKFGRSTFVSFAQLDDFEVIITGRELSASVAARFALEGVEIVRV
jgi:DeoR/GlpR family transcriptional regulator of sugar metabolism